MWIRSTPDVLPTENGKERSRSTALRLAIRAASDATVFALAIRRAAFSRLVESARALVLSRAEEYTPVGPSSNIDPHARGSQKAPHNRGL